ncbi:Predicted N-formylglutamate amidohydrolase [Delftia tsuruhatensis]|uniref:N-formylglutamate amidohydrolase n=1 Tax=Delftia tsuruhatensis TaxID=180282 RepID=UPI001E700F6E|nr:N-formylglutamate amidohydrolase [Delftia tsuruhatensis]CAB5666919.1 Predicted N-formylglutamate amidohydrolase [Delftia tsuruhatensis]CAC9677875.1 Predicted N-formylglutamate amidohydrolase [Delftia tsuruhatensis]
MDRMAENDFLCPRPDTPVVVHAATAEALPIVCDSPHSGTSYPEDFGHAVPMSLLRRGEDTHVAALWDQWPAHGATLIEATFPRTYIDPNRSEADLDPAQIDGTWPVPLTPSVKTQQGLGLIWQRISRDGVATPLYGRPRTVAEIEHRIARYWRPYHAALAQAIDGSVRRFGAVWHLNLHSMPNDVYKRLGRSDAPPLADFVLGDRDGTTCAPGFIRLVGETLAGFGYSVAYNEPYKGVELIGRIGQPHLGRHSLQIEIRRPVYMDEDTREPNAGFEPLRGHLRQVMAVVADHVRSEMAGRG